MGYAIVYKNELQHSGRKGMRWYQHIFTKDDHSSSSGRKKKSNNKENNSDEETTYSSKKSTRSVKDMSDRELEHAISRMKLEKKYAELNPQHVSLGRRFVRSVVNDVVIPATISSSKNLLTQVMTQKGAQGLEKHIKDIKIDTSTGGKKRKRTNKSDLIKL